MTSQPNSPRFSSRVPKTAELVAGHIRRQIVLGEYATNDALPFETELMENFGISRPTLREALRILESEGLITILRGSHGGARVQVPSSATAARYASLVLQYRGASISDVMRTRVIVESPAASIVASRRDRRRCAATLAKWLDEHSAGVLLAVDSEAYRSSYHGFNRLLISLTEIESLILITSMLERISDAAAAGIGFAQILDEAKLVHQTQRTRERLIEYIAAGESEKAELLFRAHLEEAGRVLAAAQGNKVVDLML